MELHRTVTEFFHEAVTQALRSRDVAAAEPTEFYLVNLLVEFTDARRVEEEPLALKLIEANQAPTPDERARALKEVGDTSLYVSGFFAASLSRRLVDVDYYIQIGGSAYAQLARLIAMTRGTATRFFREAYAELAHKFPQFVEVLGEVRASTDTAGSNDIVKLYDEWRRTGSEAIERRLRQLGVALDAPGRKLVQ